MKTMKVSGCEGYLLYAIRDRNNRLVMADYITRSAQEGKSVGANIMRGYPVTIGREFLSTNSLEYSAVYQHVNVTAYASCPECLVIAKPLYDPKNKREQRMLLTTKERMDQDLYQVLMREFDLPLLPEFVPAIREYFSRDRILTVSGESCVLYGMEDDASEYRLPGLDVPIRETVLVEFPMLSQEMLDKAVSELLRSGRISFTALPQKKMEAKNFDEYMASYGRDILKNLRDRATPLTETDGTIDHAVTKKSRLFTKQADATKGILEVLKHSKYCVVNEGMGCGKTIQTAVACDARAVRKYQMEHHVDLKTAVEKASYRAIVMAPPLMVKKWAEEIEREIVGAKAVILDSFEKVTAIKQEGMHPEGKRYYIISKDFGKLSYQKAPIPYQVKTQTIHKCVCRDCGEEKSGAGYGRCRCGSIRYKMLPLAGRQKAEGLVCPECGELLLNAAKEHQNWKPSEGGLVRTLSPADFATETNSNTKCWYCGSSLWRPLVENIGNIKKKERWYRAKRFTNATKKSTASIWLLAGHEEDYIMEKGGPGCESVDDLMESRAIRTRKFAPIKYIKDQLSGYFEYCILDEAHKYEGGATAQGSAAGWLIQASKKTLALTGTLSGGKAEDMFYLLYRLDPKRMLDRGFEFTDVTKFSSMYGCIEEVYAYDREETVEYHSTSHGRKISSPRTKPGISPLIFSHFLIDRAVFLDLTDMSNQLPPLKEKIVGVDLDPDIRQEYKRGIQVFQRRLALGQKRVLSAQLQFALSYPDKPYGRNPILDPATGEVILTPRSLDRYQHEMTNKEKALVSIVKGELGEERNCFVYAEYTRAQETNILGRLKAVLETEIPELVGKIAVLEAGSPSPAERMDWIKEQASLGKRIIICNPELCECGLDFIFTYMGVVYNYPTIIQFQMGYNLTVLWQSVSRHFRLIQTLECRTYYLYSRGTIQLEVLRLMAKKKNAVNVLQGGGFSSEGLAAMADGIDAEAALAKALQEGIGDLEEIVEELYKESDTDATEHYARDFVSHPLYAEIGGRDEVDEAVEEAMRLGGFDLFDLFVPGQNVDEGLAVGGTDSESGSVEAIREGSEPESEVPDLFDLFTVMEQCKVAEKTVSKLRIAGQVSLF